MQINDFFPNLFAKIVLANTLKPAVMLDNTDIPDIFNTDIVTTDIDATWTENEQLKSLQQKKLLIISQPYAAGSNDEVQLQKIQEACQLGQDEYQTLQMTDSDTYAWHRIKTISKPEAVLLFGIKPQQLGISALFIFNYPNKFDSTIWIPTLSLPDLSQQPEAKKQLWGNALKPIFIENK